MQREDSTALGYPRLTPQIPKLTEKTAYSKNQVYSPQDIAGLHEYGILRGVQVILEIDMPGHSRIEGPTPVSRPAARQRAGTCTVRRRHVAPCG